MIKSLREHFLRYLKESARKHAADNESIVAFAEDDLMEFIHRNHIKGFTGGIYDQTDADWWHDVRATILSNDTLKDQNYEKGGLGYSGVIKFYIGFLLSKFNPLNEKETFDDISEISLQTDNTKPIDEGPKTEGEIREMHLTTHERNPRLREECIKHYMQEHGGRIVCECCGFDFEKAYGDIGRNFIEVHHKWPISATTDEHEVNPKTDLVPLCSNCHSMIHRGNGPAHVIKWEDFVANYNKKA